MIFPCLKSCGCHASKALQRCRNHENEKEYAFDTYKSQIIWVQTNGKRARR